MNKDPLEELFGSLDETPEPVPARERLAQEQADRVRTAQFPAERGTGRATATPPGASAAAPRDRSSQAKPWIIVGIVAVVAILASIVVLNMARGDGEPTPTAAPQPTASTPAPTPTKPTPTPTEQPDEKPEEDQVPVVDVGETTSFPITQWNATSQWPQRLLGASYNILGDSELRLSGELFNSFPDSCAEMRTEWGANRQPDGSFEVAKPATKCAAAPELYDEVWGLLHAWTESITAG